MDHELAYSAVRTQVLPEILGMCVDAWPGVRMSAIQTLVGTPRCTVPRLVLTFRTSASEWKVTLSPHVRCTHVKDYTLALVRCGVGNLRGLYSRKPIRVIHRKVALCRNRVLKVFSVSIECEVFRIVIAARILLPYSYRRHFRTTYDKNRTLL